MIKHINKNKSHYLKHELVQVIQTHPRVLNFIQNAALDGLWYWDINLPENEYMDEKFWEELGYDPKEMPHSPSAWQNIIHPEDLQTANENFKKHCENPNHKYDQLVRYTHKDGSTVYIRCRGMAIRDYQGNPIRMLGCHTNVTELVNKSKELDKANVTLKNKNKELENFSYILSHDLKEPINTIQMFIALYKEEYLDKMDDQQIKYLNFISDSAERMSMLVTSLLNFNKLNIKSDAVKIDCNILVEEVMHDLGKKIKNSKAKIIFHDLPVILGHRPGIRSVFQNILNNAIKFQKPDTMPIITIESEKKNGWTFSISDNGIGIKEKDYNKIFGIFGRLDEHKDYMGSGIGLAHCKKVINMHNGEIWLDSNINQGSTFYFNINL